MIRRLLSILLLASTALASPPDPINPIPVAGSSFFTQLVQWLKNEVYQERSETQLGANFVVTGCVGTTSPGLTHAPASCTAYVAGYRIIEAGSIGYPITSTCQVILSAPLTGNISGPDGRIWTRQSGTHYLVTCAAGSQFPVNTVPIMSVVTNGTSIVSVQDIRPVSAVPNGYIGNAQLAPASIDNSKLIPNAATRFMSLGCNSSFWTVASFNSVETAVLTTSPLPTSGGRVLVMMTYSYMLSGGGAGPATIRVYRDATNTAPIAVKVIHYFIQQIFSDAIVVIDNNPPAGNHTWILTLQGGDGSTNLQTFANGGCGQIVELS